MAALTSTLFPLPDPTTLDTSAREGLLLNLNTGLVALAEYKKHMESDLTDRSSLVQALQEMANAHSLAIEANATKLQVCCQAPGTFHCRAYADTLNRDALNISSLSALWSLPCSSSSSNRSQRPQRMLPRACPAEGR